MNPFYLDCVTICLCGALLWCVLALRDRAHLLAAAGAAGAVEKHGAEIGPGGRDDEDLNRDRRRQAIVITQWCRDRMKVGLDHGCEPPPGIGRIAADWCAMLDNVEVCGIDIIGADVLTRHLLGHHAPGVPPFRGVADFADWRRTHGWERRQIRDEIEARHAARMAQEMLAATREREGKAAGGGPRRKAGEIQTPAGRGRSEARIVIEAGTRSRPMRSIKKRLQVLAK